MPIFSNHYHYYISHLFFLLLSILLVHLLMQIYSRSKPTPEPSHEALTQPTRVSLRQFGGNHNKGVLVHPHAVADEALQQAVTHQCVASSTGQGQKMISACDDAI